MKKVLVLTALLFSSALVYGMDWINEDYSETNMNAFHSYGLLSYGFHSNTFHLRNFFLRYNITPLSTEDTEVQIFATLSGFKDTHVPETNYTFILNNLNLYDYGVTYRFFQWFFVSLRGMAPYRLNYDTYLLFPSYTSTNNPAEFDSPQQYIERMNSPAGIRLGFISKNFEVAYSQGDYRHAIPSAVLLKLNNGACYIRGVVQYQHTNPLIFEPTVFTVVSQLSAGGEYQFGELTFGALAEVTWQMDGDVWFRAEQALTWNDYTLAVREIVPVQKPALFEASIKRNFAGYCSIGLFGATDGRAYLATEINF